METKGPGYRAVVVRLEVGNRKTVLRSPMYPDSDAGFQQSEEYVKLHSYPARRTLGTFIEFYRHGEAATASDEAYIEFCDSSGSDVKSANADEIHTLVNANTYLAD